MLTLANVDLEKPVRVLDLGAGAAKFRQKLLSMGVLPGVIIKICKIAPFGDPFLLNLRGYTLSLRKQECEQIHVEYIKQNQAVTNCAASSNSTKSCSCRES